MPTESKRATPLLPQNSLWEKILSPVVAPIPANERERLTISFSGGRSSAVMLHRIYAREIAKRPVVVTFANTGAEHPATLDFVRDVEKHWRIPIVWLEAIITPELGVGPRAKVVTYETASRAGEPFRAAVAKHGVFSSAMPQCTSRLKTQPMRAYFRDHLGWKRRTYTTAIGLRSDEIDRMNFGEWDRGDLWYPLIEENWNRDAVNAYMTAQPFDLQLPGSHYGNCVTCWKKSFRKLFTIAQDDPEHFRLFRDLETEFGHLKRDKPAAFFRGQRRAEQIIGMAATTKFIRFEDSKQATLYNLEYDQGGACGDSCEIGADDADTDEGDE